MFIKMPVVLAKDRVLPILVNTDFIVSIRPLLAKEETMMLNEEWVTVKNGCVLTMSGATKEISIFTTHSFERTEQLLDIVNINENRQRPRRSSIIQ